jgi:hypothetical protein
VIYEQRPVLDKPYRTTKPNIKCILEGVVAEEAALQPYWTTLQIESKAPKLDSVAVSKEAALLTETLKSRPNMRVQLSPMPAGIPLSATDSQVEPISTPSTSPSMPLVPAKKGKDGRPSLTPSPVLAPQSVPSIAIPTPTTTSTDTVQYGGGTVYPTYTIPQYFPHYLPQLPPMAYYPPYAYQGFPQYSPTQPFQPP